MTRTAPVLAFVVACAASPAAPDATADVYALPDGALDAQAVDGGEPCLLVCNDGWICCAVGSYYCADPLTDPDDCGGCEIACAPTDRCVMGVCQPS